MIFRRSIPSRAYQNYRSYRSLLRIDFCHRCVYCLRHEGHLGGEANFDIDHHRPRNGAYARPDLENIYTNLHYCCKECNGNKSDIWPSLGDYAQGLRFIDPCYPEDDHDLHWKVESDGSLTPLTNTGRYTIRHLKLWRAQLKDFRSRCFRWQNELQEISELLNTRQLPDEIRQHFETMLTELREWIEPPVFDRPHGTL